jgi:hypothetical protein
MEGPTSKKTNEPPKRVNFKGNIKFPLPPPLARSISNKERGGPLERMPRNGWKSKTAIRGYNQTFESL